LEEAKHIQPLVDRDHQNVGRSRQRHTVVLRNLLRACKRWFGLPPGQFRTLLLTEPEAAPTS
jgi:hypothetical protein